MTPQAVQALVLRAPHGPAVAHQILCIPNGCGGAATRVLAKLKPTFGVQGPGSPCCSIGFSFAGLEALGMPNAYLRLFRRLAPAFTAGAVRRSGALGDSGASASQHWDSAFDHGFAHVLVSWHGQRPDVKNAARQLADMWCNHFGIDGLEPLVGERLGHPANEDGEWVHFGFRDGLSEVCIDEELPRPAAPDRRSHAPGALLLGHVNDAGFNPFVLNRAPEKVRAFFRDSSFGILRPMAQDLTAFEQQLDQWATKLGGVIKPPKMRDFIKAKLCGRWPNGHQPLPGELEPNQSPPVLDLRHDHAGEGCPFGSHVRRMRAAPGQTGRSYERPLQRRSLPFGQAAWSGRPTDGEPRGLLGHFFCANIEDQFEHLLGQWAARPPLGFGREDRALDPFIGPHEEASAALLVPLKGLPTQQLHGFSAWTTTLGTMYAWHPSRCALQALWDDDFEPDDKEGPWL